MDELKEAQARLAQALDRARAGAAPLSTTTLRSEGARLVQLLHGLLGAAQLRSPADRAFDQPFQDLEATLGRLLRVATPLQLVTVEGEVYVNDIRIRSEGTASVPDLGGELRGHGVGGLAFHARLSEPQLRLLVTAIVESPERGQPRQALGAALSEKGLGCVELLDMLSHHETKGTAVGERDQRGAAAVAARLIDRELCRLAAGRLPHPLPLRRAVVRLLESGASEEPLLEDPAGASPHAARTLRICRLALLLGRALGLPEGALQDLGVAAMFHDVGYAASERASSASRPSAGARLLMRQRGFHEAKLRRVRATLDHRRRFDDPRGRPSLFGRLLAVVEDYDSCTRALGDAASPADALGSLLHEAGTVYDPVLVQLFADTLGRFPPGSRLQLADGSQARALSPARGPETFDTPVVRIERLADGSIPPQEVRIDLALRPDLLPKARPEPAAEPVEEPAPDIATPLPSLEEDRPEVGVRPRPLFQGVLPQVLRDIYAGRKSGFLHLTSDLERRSVRFWQGNMVYGRSNLPQEQLEEVALREGLLSRTDLERAIETAQREKERLGSVLCRLGILTQAQLENLVALHAREVLVGAIPWKKGSYHFEPKSEEPSWLERLPSRLSTADLILEAARAVDATEAIAWHLGNVDRVLERAKEGVGDTGPCNFTPLDAFVLSRVDGTLTAREIISIVPQEARQVQRCLFRLLCIGLVRYKPPAKPDAPEKH